MHDNIKLSQFLKDYEAELHARELEAESVHAFIINHFHHKAEAIYEDAIIDLVGVHGLDLLREFHLIEGCGVIEDRKLYAV